MARDAALEPRRPQRPAVHPANATGEWSGVFEGMVFAILAFIGFEAAAPLGEEARLHVALPIAGIVLFFLPLHHRFSKAPPAHAGGQPGWRRRGRSSASA